MALEKTETFLMFERKRDVIFVVVAVFVRQSLGQTAGMGTSGIVRVKLIERKSVGVPPPGLRYFVHNKTLQ